jgi:hypothetical protein
MKKKKEEEEEEEVGVPLPNSLLFLSFDSFCFKYTERTSHSHMRAKS